MKNPARAIGRRRFLKAVPAAVAATVAAPALAQRGGGAPPKFGKEVLKCAEQLDGLHFTDAEEEMAAGGASRNLDSYEELRKLDIPLDTEPAMTFRPYDSWTRKRAPRPLVNIKPIARPTHTQVPADLEELAFEPVTVLASLIESRKVSSADLTMMYLARLKRYGDQLHCIVTLIEDLAARPRPPTRRSGPAFTAGRCTASCSAGRISSHRDQTTRGAKPYGTGSRRWTRRSSSGCATPAAGAGAQPPMGVPPRRRRGPGIDAHSWVGADNSSSGSSAGRGARRSPVWCVRDRTETGVTPSRPAAWWDAADPAASAAQRHGAERSMDKIWSDVLASKTADRLKHLMAATAAMTPSSMRRSTGTLRAPEAEIACRERVQHRGGGGGGRGSPEDARRRRTPTRR
jgi:hypothetical protein